MRRASRPLPTHPFVRPLARLRCPVLALLIALSGLSTGQTLAVPDRLDVVAPWEIASRDPAISGHIFQRMGVAETLVGADTEGALEPLLARSWQASEDGRTWTFKLREDVRFHDNTLFNAAAVKQSLERALAGPSVLRQAGIERIEAPEPHTLVIELAAPRATLPALLAHASTLILAPDSWSGEAPVAIIGTGPYAVARLETPQRLVTRAFADYYEGAPAIAAASYLAAPRGETRALMARSGDADVVFNLDPASRRQLERLPSLTLHAEPIPRTVALKLNAALPAFETAELRRALSLAIDRRGIADSLLRTPEAAAGQLFPPVMGDWHLADLDTPPHDPRAALAAFEAAGWQRDDRGRLVRDGEPLELSLVTFADRPELPLIATALQAQLAEIGIEVAVSVANASAIPAGHQDHSLEMGLLARNYGLVPEPLGTLMGDFAPEGGGWGAMNWSSQALTEHLAELATLTPQSPRYHTLAQESARQLHEERPLVPIAWYLQTAAVNAAVAGFRIDPFELDYRIDDMRFVP